MPTNELERLHAHADEWLIRSGARVVLKKLPSGTHEVRVTLPTGAAAAFVCASDDEYREELVLAVDALRT